MREEFKTKCAICGKLVANANGLAQHLRNAHNIQGLKNIKNKYFDVYIIDNPNELKKEKYCCVCGGEMSFYETNNGYRANKSNSGNQYCKHCRNLNPDSKKIRSKNWKDKAEHKKIEEGYYELPEVCMICLENSIEKRFENKYDLSKHLSIHNGIHRFGDKELEEYHIKYLGGKPSKCKRDSCNNATKFISLIKGFAVDSYCNISCASLDRDAAAILLSPEAIINRKQTCLKKYGVDSYSKTKEFRLQRREMTLSKIENCNGQVTPYYNSKGCHIIEILNDKGFDFQHAERGGEYRVIGYFLDGYDKKRNIAIEIDESHHYLGGCLKLEDVRRQKEIIKELGCRFIRIKVNKKGSILDINDKEFKKILME